MWVVTVDERKHPAGELVLVVKGRPIAKKNNPRAFAICPKGCPGQQANLIKKRMGQKIQRPHINLLPSEDYEIYEKMALQQLLQWGNIQFTGKVIVEVFYWMPDRRSHPDLLGLEQATADILEKSGIITNDRNIVRWGDSHIVGVDKESPRAEILIREFV